MLRLRALRSPAAPWSSRERALFVLLSVLTIALAIESWRNRVHIGTSPAEGAPLAGELADRIDPNTADWTQLAAIPGIGEKKARAIVQTREQLRMQHPERPAFQIPDDLRQVKGIGPAIAANMRPYLIFPTDPPRPSTRP